MNVKMINDKKWLNVLRMTIIFLCFTISSIAQVAKGEYYFKSILNNGEGWWGGVVVDGPFNAFWKV